MLTLARPLLEYALEKKNKSFLGGIYQLQPFLSEFSVHFSKLASRALRLQ